MFATWLHAFALTFALEGGYLPSGGWTFHTAENDFEGSLVNIETYSLFSAMLKAPVVFAKVDVKTYAYKKKGRNIGFVPNDATYNVSAGLHYKGLQLGFRHYCKHPISVYTRYTRYPSIEGYYQEIFLRVKKELYPFKD